MDKRGSLPVVIFVLGVLGICIFALLVFAVNFNKENEFTIKGLESFYGLREVIEDIHLELNKGMNLDEAVQEVQNKYSGYNIGMQGNIVKIERKIIIKKGLLFWREDKEIFSVERNIRFK